MTLPQQGVEKLLPRGKQLGVAQHSQVPLKMMKVVCACTPLV